MLGSFGEKLPKASCRRTGAAFVGEVMLHQWQTFDLILKNILRLSLLVGISLLLHRHGVHRTHHGVGSRASSHSWLVAGLVGVLHSLHGVIFLLEEEGIYLPQPKHDEEIEADP